jgi:hypothetical protein
VQYSIIVSIRPIDTWMPWSVEVIDCWRLGETYEEKHVARLRSAHLAEVTSATTGARPLVVWYMTRARLARHG